MNAFQKAILDYLISNGWEEEDELSLQKGKLGTLRQAKIYNNAEVTFSYNDEIVMSSIKGEDILREDNGLIKHFINY